MPDNITKLAKDNNIDLMEGVKCDFDSVTAREMGDVIAWAQNPTANVDNLAGFFAKVVTAGVDGALDDAETYANMNAKKFVQLSNTVATLFLVYMKG